MKKSIFTVAVLLLTFASAPAVAASYCNPILNVCQDDGDFTEVFGSNCATTTNICWGGYDITSCKSCRSGYKLSSATLSSTQCTNTYQYNTCVPNTGTGGGCGTACDNCFATGWRNVNENIGYQQRQTAQCDESTNCKCIRGYEYRCSAGYYGASPSCMTLIGAGTQCSGCSQCPDVPDKVDWVDESYSITSAAGSTLVTQCYIDGTATNHYIADETGHYTIAGGKCYYKRILSSNPGLH